MKIAIELSGPKWDGTRVPGRTYEIVIEKGASHFTIECPECNGLGGSGGYWEPLEPCYWCVGEGVISAVKHYGGKFREWWHGKIPERVWESWFNLRYDKPHALKTWLFGPFIMVCQCCKDSGADAKYCRREHHYEVETRSKTNPPYGCWLSVHRPTDYWHDRKYTCRGEIFHEPD